MVKGRKLMSTTALTFVEVIVTSVLMGIVFTGIMATMTITMKRISTTAQMENDEKQMDRFQMEVSHYGSRSSELRILDDAGDEVVSGNRLVCVLQEDPVEPSEIRQMEFSYTPPSSPQKKASLSVKVTLADTSLPSKTYSYTSALEPLGAGESMFGWEPNGFLEYNWKLDSGYGTESFNNMVIPKTSL